MSERTDAAAPLLAVRDLSVGFVTERREPALVH